MGASAMAPLDATSETSASTIADFVGDFESTGEQKIISGGNAAWYPPKGVRLRVTDHSDDPCPHARIEVLPGSPHFEGEVAVEEARYRLVGKMLYAVMELQPGFFLTELLEMLPNGNMKHTLSFVDPDRQLSSLGYWICRP
jgi:hypothetical protein